jgi:hypothetical protein
MKRPILPFGIVLAGFCLAPTVGDVGGCAEASSPLDASRFFQVRAQTICQRCGDCGLSTRTCALDCAGDDVPTAFPAGCAPVVHDGEVCVRAIESISCSDVTALVSAAPITPTECDFCPAALADGGP